MVAMNVWPTDASDGAVTSEARWRKMGRVWAPTGVIVGQGGNMVPTLAYPNLTVRAGACWVDGHYCELTADQVLAVTANGIAVVRFDPAANTAELLYRDGITTPAQSPTGTYEIVIAKLTGSVMTDMRLPLVDPNAGRLAGFAQATLAVPSFSTGAWIPLGGISVMFDSYATHRYSIHFYGTLGNPTAGSWMGLAVTGEGLTSAGTHNLIEWAESTPGYGQTTHGEFVVGPGAFLSMPTKAGATLGMSAFSSANTGNANGAFGFHVTDLGAYA